MKTATIVVFVILLGFLAGCGQKIPSEYFPEHEEQKEKPTEKELQPHYSKDSRTGICYAWVVNSNTSMNNYSFSMTTVDCEKVKDYIGK